MNRLIWMLLAVIFLNSCKKEDSVLKSANFYNTAHTENWMSDLLTAYPNESISLKDICLPRAHDAGVYEVNNCFLGNACNTQTQYLDMEAMLKSGIRMFDVRPVLKNGVYWTYHATGCNGAGCEGDELAHFLEQTKTFLDTHNELVILEINSFCNTTAQDEGFLSLLTSMLGDRIYKEVSPMATDFIYRPLSDILPPDSTSGKVVLLMDGLNTSTENRAEGFFANSYIPRDGSYANKFIFEETY